MTRDLVERLRNGSAARLLREEAAAEIERLRSENAALRASAEQHRALTKAGIAAAKARGVTLGNPRLHEIAGKGAATNAERAARFAAEIAPVIRQVQQQGAVSFRAIARELSSRGIKTARGNTKWSAVTVSKILARAPA